MGEYDDVARATAMALARAVGKVRRRSRETLKDGQLRLPEIETLAQIDRDAPVAIADMARHQQITPQAVGATFAAL